MRKAIKLAAGTSMEKIKPLYKLVPGIYQVEVTAPGGEITTFKSVCKVTNLKIIHKIAAANISGWLFYTSITSARISINSLGAGKKVQ